jgi:hypothetical protein
MIDALDRRDYLASLTAVSTFLAGCNSSSTAEPSTPSATPTQTQTATATASSTATPEPRFPESGTLNVQLNGENPWPDDYFSGNVDMPIGMTAEELRKRFHFDQYKDIARGVRRENEEKGRLLREFPRNLDNPEWVEENVYSRWEKKYNENVEDIFKEEVYMGEGPLDQRYTESRFPSAWKMVEILAMDRISSGHDYVRSAELAAAEHYTANKGKDRNTFVTEHTTQDKGHGLGLAMTNLTYDEAKTEQQETWGIETDPGEDQAIWDLDQLQKYPNRASKHPVTVEGTKREEDMIRGLGFTVYDVENINLEVPAADKFEDFLKEPGKQLGMKYVDGICTAAAINAQATEDGRLPEFQDATITIHDNQIEYELA